jgi:DNA mismatch endonuclease (patch repair protein)
MAISRSENMGRIRSRDSSIELAVRRELHKSGLRYRCCVKGLPGKPDIVFSKKKIAVFIHGCFWHQHKACQRANIPKSNREYWAPKLAANVARDEKHGRELSAMGFRVITIWGCEVERDVQAMAARVAAALNGKVD